MFFVVVGVLTVWGIVGFVVPQRVEGDLPGAAQLGDSFGLVAALFSGLAFAGVIVAILLQRAELRLQRRELELTRGELAGQKQAMLAQVKAAERQAFDSTFFQLLSLHQEVLAAIELSRSGGGTVFNGRRAVDRVIMPVLQRELSQVDVGERAGDRPGNLTGQMNQVSAIWLQIYGRFETSLSHYFRLLYRIVRYVHRSELEEEMRRAYVGHLRAQLSTNELILLLYNSFGIGREKFLPLIVEYRLLDPLNIDHLPDSRHFRVLDEYAKGTFGRSLTSPDGPH